MDKVKELNNFEIHDEAEQLSDTHTGYALARLYITKREELAELQRRASGNIKKPALTGFLVV